MSQEQRPSGPPGPTAPTGPSGRRAGISDGLLLGVLGLMVGLAVLTWSASGIGGWLRHGSWPDGVSFLRTGPALRGFLTEPADIPGAWTAADPATLPSATLVWSLFFGQLVLLFSLVLWVWVRWTKWRLRREAARLDRAAELAAAATPAVEQPVGERRAEPAGSPGPELPTTAEVAAPVPVPTPPPVAPADPVSEVLDAGEGLVVVDPTGALWAKTAKQRGRRGPVHVYDPGHLSQAPVRLRWAPQRDCADMARARTRAVHLLAPVRPAEPVFQLDVETAETLLRCYLHAAALAGEPFPHVQRWSNGRSAGEPGKILRTHSRAAGGAAMELESALTTHPGRRDAALTLIGQALRPLEQVHVRQSCSPGRVDDLALDNLTNEGGTLYVIGTGPDTAGLRGALVAAVTEDQPQLTVVRAD
ncbi:type VI secretion protein [Streptomyces sp. DSM 44915]|uniref:Type VI secretion protein n=1 Tax=Streptomyces chisholmiae TaxID=3075540 RepID=A0ABU2JU77_9ACTN|nr:type VI secretion protein [Streptomyces sp. DSM 44915]MDT0268069.1 type VI secretion protein [Streptomyces sp. DSM 44915]